MPRRPQNVIFRKGSRNAFYRVDVPKELRPILGKREIRRSLGTSDPVEIRRRKLEVEREIQAVFDTARRRLNPSMPRPDELRAAVIEHYRDLLSRDLDDRQIRGDGREALLGGIPYVLVLDEPFDEWQARRLNERDALKRGLARRQIPLEIANRALGLASDRGWAIAPGDEEFRHLCEMLVEAEREAHRRADERDEGDYYGAPATPLLARTVPLPLGDQAVPTLMEAFEQYAATKTDVQASHLAADRSKLAVMDLYLGGSAPVTAITKRRFGDFLTAMRDWPVRASHDGLDGRSFAEIVEQGRRAGRAAISPKTVNEYRNAVSRLVRYLAHRDLIEGFDTSGLTIRYDRQKRTYRPFTSAELKAIFGAPIFQGVRSTRFLHSPGNHLAFDWRSWAQLVALHSGMRLGEILQLHLADIREQQGIWVFDVTEYAEEGDQKLVKSRAGRRIVPVHSVLLDQGFLEFVEWQKTKGAARLFPNVKRYGNNRFSKASSWFTEHHRRCGIDKSDRRCGFHSFRSSFITALAVADYLEHEYQPLVGHEVGSVTRGYRGVPELSVERRKQLVEAVRFDLPPIPPFVAPS